MQPWVLESHKLEFWPEHVRAILVAAAEGLAGRPPAPEHTAAMSRSPFPEHTVTWEHFDPDEEQPEGVYELEVIGNPYGGRWDFQPKQLAALMAEAGTRSA
jgi:hypothetical protein